MKDTSLGKMIAKYRVDKGLSQEKVAELLGVSRQAVTKWEGDLSRPSSDNLIALAELLEVSMDELLGHAPVEQTDRAETRCEVKTEGEPGRDINSRLAWLFFGISCACMIAYPIISALLDRFSAGTMIMIFILVIPCQLFIHGVFSSAAKTGNFSMIAGYDPQMSYNVPEYKRVLHMIDLSIGCTTSVYVFLFCVLSCAGVGGEWLGEILLFLYVIQLVGDLLLINLKNADRLYTNKEDAKRVKVSLPIDLAFILLILANCAGLAVGIGKRNSGISEASVGALCFAMFVGLIAALIGLFVEENRIKKWDPSESNYRISALSIVCAIFSILMIVIMVIAV